MGKNDEPQKVNPYAEKPIPISKKIRMTLLIKKIVKWPLIILAVWAYFYFSQPYQRADYVNSFGFALSGDFASAGRVFRSAFSHNPIAKKFKSAGDSYNRWVKAGQNKLDTKW